MGISHELHLKACNPFYLIDSSMDEATATSVLEVQLQDLADILQNRKGKEAVGRINDAELACQIQIEEFRARLAFLSDYRMSRSINKAMQDDDPVLSTLYNEESSSFHDRQMARRLAGLPEETPPPTDNQQCRSEDLLAGLSALSVSRDDHRNYHGGVDAESEAGESSSKSILRDRPRSLDTQYECLACTERILLYEDIQAPCSHHYCRKCIVKLFDHSTTDESLFPARCCGQQIPVSLVGSFLDPNLIQRIEEKAVEFGTLDRTYCAQTSCASFIPPNHIHDNTATCPLCSERTCSLCKQPTHDEDCPQDVELQSTLRTAQEAGWQRCYQCRTMVELTVGCNHIT